MGIEYTGACSCCGIKVDSEWPAIFRDNEPYCENCYDDALDSDRAQDEHFAEYGWPE